jgi:TRAP-type C4-dicarboxylate transport system permease small subunit
MLEPIRRAARAASAGLLAVGAAGLVAMTGIVGWQVFGRYVLNSSPSWSEQASLTLMIWYVSFAAAAGVREGFHIRILAVQNAAPPKLRDALKTVADLAVGALGVAMAVWGGELVGRTWSHEIPTLGLPRGVAYLPLPIAGALMTLFALERILERLGGIDEESEGGSRWS